MGEREASAEIAVLAQNASNVLKVLKHTSSIREYVKEFSSLMQDIPNMSGEDKLFNFFSG